MSDVADLTLKVLERIQAEIATLSAKVDQTSARLERIEISVTGVRAGVTGLREEVVGLCTEVHLQAERTERGTQDLLDLMRKIVRDRAKHAEVWHTSYVNKLERD